MMIGRTKKLAICCALLSLYRGVGLCIEDKTEECMETENLEQDSEGGVVGVTINNGNTQKSKSWLLGLPIAFALGWSGHHLCGKITKGNISKNNLGNSSENKDCNKDSKHLENTENQSLATKSKISELKNVNLEITEPDGNLSLLQGNSSAIAENPKEYEKLKEDLKIANEKLESYEKKLKDANSTYSVVSSMLNEEKVRVKKITDENSKLKTKLNQINNTGNTQVISVSNYNLGIYKKILMDLLAASGKSSGDFDPLEGYISKKITLYDKIFLKGFSLRSMKLDIESLQIDDLCSLELCDSTPFKVMKREKNKGKSFISILIGNAVSVVNNESDIEKLKVFNIYEGYNYNGHEWDLQIVIHK